MKAIITIVWVVGFLLIGGLLLFDNQVLEDTLGFRKEEISTYISFLAFIVSGVSLFKWHDDKKTSLYMKAEFDSPVERNLIFEVTNKSLFPVTIVDFGHAETKCPFAKIKIFHSQKFWQNLVSVDNINKVPITIPSNEFKKFSYNFVTEDPNNKGYGYVVTSDDKKFWGWPR